MFSKIVITTLVWNLLTIQCFSQQTNYAEKSNWAVFPGNYTKELKSYLKDSSLLTKVDVFYVYPTVFLDKADERWNIPLEDENQRRKILDNVIRFQASAWVEAGSMYVPFYRQAHIRSYRNLETGGREAIMLAYSDVKEAFQYYLDNYNNGRPIILAGHSQGSTHLMLLLKDFFDNKPLQSQLVAAYLPGIGIKKNEYQSLKLLTDSTQTGGYVSWNTFKKKLSKEKYENWYKGSSVVNPVTWDLSKTAERKLHKGFLFNNNSIYRQSFTTHLIDGAIWISTPHFPYRSMAWTMDDYHIGDVNLFWEDVRHNAKLRSSQFLKDKKY